MTSQQTTAFVGGKQAALERAYLEEYLHSVGHSLATVAQLPVAEAKPLMQAASGFASMRLAEVEARAQLVEELHGRLANGRPFEGLLSASGTAMFRCWLINVF
ncbi:hypothetical protein HC891_15180 [Candidatus Gracilibacteria bacterium]|nr:hypothetical protein [Candidatus Gracilibacteria bacterium]